MNENKKPKKSINSKSIFLLMTLFIVHFESISFAKNEVLNPSFQELHQNIYFEVFKNFNLKDLFYLKTIDKRFNEVVTSYTDYLMNQKILSPEILDEQIEDLAQIENFSKKHLNFILEINLPLQKRLIEKIADHDLNKLEKILKRKKDINLSHAYIAFLYSIYVINFSSAIEASGNVSYSLLKKILYINTITDESWHEATFKALKKIIESNPGIFIDLYTGSAWSNFYFDSKTFAYNHLAKLVSSPKHSNLVLFKSDIFNLTDTMVLFLNFKTESKSFEKVYNHIYKHLQKQNSQITIDQVDQIILPILEEDPFKDNRWIIELKKSLRKAKEVINQESFN